MKRQKIKSILVFVLAAAILMLLLSACGSGNTTDTTPSGNERGDTPDMSTVTDSENDPPVLPYDPADDGRYDSIPENEAYVVMDIQYYDEESGSVLEIPHIVDSGDSVIALNARLDDLKRQYERFLEPSEYGEWCEVVCYPCETDRYINLVISDITYPNYGTDGTLTTAVYDKKERREITLEEAMKLNGISEDDILTSFGLWAQSWAKSEEELTPDGGAATARYNGIIGFRMLDDTNAEYYLSITTAREMANEWIEIFSFRDSAIFRPTDETGTQFLISADNLMTLSLESPLWATRPAE